VCVLLLLVDSVLTLEELDFFIRSRQYIKALETTIHKPLSNLYMRPNSEHRNTTERRPLKLFHAEWGQQGSLRVGGTVVGCRIDQSQRLNVIQARD
jgi:hypothetical protein